MRSPKYPGELIEKSRKLPKTFAGKSTKLGKGGRFALIKAKAKAAGAKNPGAVAAKIGMLRYGKAKMTKMAAAGRVRAALNRKK